MRILFADDSAVTRTLVTPILAAQGHEVAAAENGTEAWDLWQSVHHPVVIADWFMPGIDGLELCRRIRADPHGGGTYFILQTGRTADSMQATESGVDQFLNKPIVPAELLASVKAAAEALGL